MMSQNLRKYGISQALHVHKSACQILKSVILILPIKQVCKTIIYVSIENTFIYLAVFQ